MVIRLKLFLKILVMLVAMGLKDNQSKRRELMKEMRKRECPEGIKVPGVLSYPSRIGIHIFLKSDIGRAFCHGKVVMQL